MTNPQDMNQLQVEDEQGLAAPPRLLLLGLIGLLVLAVVGGLAALYIFRNVLTTGQQFRIVTIVPFMTALMPPHTTPEGGIVPTANVQPGGISPQDLLNMPLGTITAPPQESPAASTNTPPPTNVSVLPTPSSTPSLATVVPTATPTQMLSPTPPADTVDTARTSQVSVNVPLIPSAARLYGFRHEQQTWNNCGPANITMALSYYGWTRDQAYAAQFLKPGGKEDKNVSPGEMVSFVNEQTGVRAITRMGGDLDLLKDFIASEFPVIIETGYMPEGYDWIGHYQTVVGYDDLQKVFYIYDSFLGTGANGEGITETYPVIDSGWEAFNRTFIVVFDRPREAEVAAILGERADPVKAAEHAFDVAQEEARANPQNGFAWFNMGTSLTKLGEFDRAARAFDKAREVNIPWRMLWYQFGPFEAYYKVGRYDDVLSLAQVNITNGASDVEETYYWQGLALIAEGERDQAASSFRLALRGNPHYQEAKDALDSLS